MFFTSHLVAGALIGRRVRNPLLAFAVGTVSHLAMDALPHWGPRCESDIRPMAMKDGVVAAGFLGYLLRRRPTLSTWAAVAGAGLLDLRYPFREFLGFSPFPRAIDRLHDRVQNERPEWVWIELPVGTSLMAAGTPSRNLGHR